MAARLLLFVCPASVAAAQPATQPAAATQPAPFLAPRPIPSQALRLFELTPAGAGYLSHCDASRCESRLRYNEDYSFLDPSPSPATRPAPEQPATAPAAEPERDWLLNLKNMDLGGRWRADFGGEYRLRVENRTNPTFGLEDRTANTQQNYRWLAHANVRYGKLFRVFLEGMFTHVEDQDGPFQPTQEDHGDIHQLFGDLRFLGEDIPLTLRIGRQELAYGHARLIGPFEWVSNRRAFDGIKLLYTSDLWDIDAFWVRPVEVKRTQLDSWNDDYNFYGVYSTLRPWKDHGIDTYFLGVDRSDHAVNPNDHAGGRSTYTMGARFWGKSPPFDYDTEVAGQWGRWAGDSVGAWLWEADAGYTYPHVTQPRISIGLGFETGDDDPFDRRVGTWDQLFPYDQACLSFPDLVGRQNVQRATITGDIWPVPEKLKLTALFHLFWLHEGTDAFYNAGGIPVLRDRFGHHGRELGSELDLLAEWRLTSHSSLLFGYSHFWNGAFIDHMVPGSDEAGLLFVQYQFKF